MLLKGDDYKAEAMIAFWIDNEEGVLDKVTIMPSSTFERSYKSDVLEIVERDSLFTVKISREGLYDMLPEGLFHEGKRKAQKTTVEAVQESIRYRQEERAARKFFLPLEQEFYRQRIWLEHLELKASLNSISSQNVSMFLDFWGIKPDQFSLDQNNFMLALLPNIHRIAGNLLLSAYCLEILIQEPVTIKLIAIPEQILPINDPLLSNVGEMILGVDSVLGRSFLDDDPGLLIKIGPVPVNKVYSFLPGCIADKQLKLLYGFFFPAEAEIFTELIILKEKNEFAFVDEELSFSRLGYTSRI